MVILLLLCMVLAESLRFCALPSDIQSLKSSIQIEKHYAEVKKYYVRKSKDPLGENMDMNVFMLLSGRKLASYIQVSLSTCYFQSSRTRLPYLSLFSVTVTNEYRCQGLSYRIIIESLEYLKKRHRLAKNCIVALHLSPDDKKMPIAAKAYYRLGFRKGVFSKYGPQEYVFKGEDLLSNSRDLFDVADNPTIGCGEGYYFLVFCRLGDVRKGYPLPADALEKTQKLFEILKNRQNKA